MTVGLMDRLHVYEERTGKYLSYFKYNVDGARIVVDVGCGAGTFSRALGCRQRLVIALDVEIRLLKEIENCILKEYARMPIPSQRRLGGLRSLSLLEYLENPEKCMKEFLQSTKAWWNDHYSAPKPSISF